jgi:2-methylcitrate dehydratase
MKLDFDWSKENFELIRKCVLKKYNAEVHSQSTIEAVVKLKDENDFLPGNIEKIDITTFLTSYHIIGGGAYGDRKTVHSKEQADHSLFYLVAVALLDGEIYPEQFEPERIKRDDVQRLLQKVTVHTGFPLHKPVTLAGILDPYTQAYPDKVKTKAEIHLAGGKKLECTKEDYPGFFTQPFTWEQTIQKFRRLSAGTIDKNDEKKIIDVIQNLENESMETLIDLICVPGNRL